MRTKRILTVDDEPDFRNLAVRHLNLAGFECIAAADSSQGLDYAAKRSPDLILLDIGMKGMNGFNVLKALRQDRRTASIPVIIVTGDSANAKLLASACENMDVSAFVHKPVEWADMSALIQRTLKGAISSSNPDLIVRGPLSIDVKLRCAFAGENRVKLGPKRFDLLLALARSKDGLATPLLAAMVYGSSSPRILGLVILTVYRLRSNLRRACAQEMIVNIPGGYKLL